MPDAIQSELVTSNDVSELLGQFAPETATPRNHLVQFLQILALASLFAAAFVGHAWWQAGSLGHVIPYVRGEHLLFDPQSILIVNTPGNTVAERVILVSNLTSSPVTLLGSQKSCGCIAMEVFPIVVPANGAYELKLQVGVPDTGKFDHSLKVFSDYDGYHTTLITVSGNAL